MKLNDTLQGLVQYFTEGFARIFSPAKDDYKDIGVQPYDCKPYIKTQVKKTA
ncbi:MAG: isochorismate synthase [Crocosphaera sp.]|nr:isochorismate synthase [Crocosphaera sp.]